jgi:hypothetical protein
MIMKRKRRFIMIVETNRIGRRFYVVKEEVSRIKLAALTSDAVKLNALKLLHTLTGKRFPKKIRYY